MSCSILDDDDYDLDIIDLIPDEEDIESKPPSTGCVMAFLGFFLFGGIVIAIHQESTAGIITLSVCAAFWLFAVVWLVVRAPSAD